MSRQQQDIDELFEVKNSFYIGNYQRCINEAQSIKKPSTPEIAVERDIFTYRAYMAQNKYLVVLDEINSSSPLKIQPLKLLAEYLSNKQNRDDVVKRLEQQLATLNVENDTLIVVAAIIYMHESNLEAAYRVLHSSESLEALALVLDILLKLNRVDLAKKKLKEMQDKDDDATLTQLAQAWINIAVGNDKLQDAFYIYQELVDKYGTTSILLNGLAVTMIGQGNYGEAETILQEALDKDPNHPDTLINLIVLSHRTGKLEVANRYMSQLKDKHADHPYLVELKQKENDFDCICQQFGPSNTSPIPLVA